ncbi:MAG: hypothetical protein ACYSO0_02535, partial [Planctomycetota bacterium]
NIINLKSIKGIGAKSQYPEDRKKECFRGDRQEDYRTMKRWGENYLHFLKTGGGGIRTHESWFCKKTNPFFQALAVKHFTHVTLL